MSPQQGTPRPLSTVPTPEVREMLEDLICEYGGVSALSRVMADRHRLSADSCARELVRIRHGHVNRVLVETYDRLWVM